MPAPSATAAPPTATHTPQPTAAPQVAPTATSAEASVGAASASASHTFNGQVVDPPWWPCAQGQIKANRNSRIYHAPGGAFYAKTYADVWCVDSEAQAIAGGFRKSKR